MPGETDPTELRISDLDRDQAARLLGSAMQQGRLTPLEYSDRCQAAYAAVTRAELLAVLADLPEELGPPALGPLVLHVPFGQVRRTGRWPVPELIRITGTGQRTSLDLTGADLGRPEVVIEVAATMSATTVLLPAHAVVDTDGLELVAGAVRRRWSTPGRSRGGLLRGWRSGRLPEPTPVRFVLRGRAMLSTVTVWQPRPLRRR